MSDRLPFLVINERKATEIFDSQCSFNVTQIPHAMQECLVQAQGFFEHLDQSSTDEADEDDDDDDDDDSEEDEDEDDS
jgi:hypothetical protein